MRQGDAPAHLVSLAQTLENVEGELRQMRYLLADLEQALFGWTATLDAPNRPPAELHNVDLLSQSAEELAGFVARLAVEVGGGRGQAGAGLHLDIGRALSDVRLGRLKLTLGRRGAADQAPAARYQPKPSTVDLF